MELSAGLILYRIQRLPELLLLNDTLNSNKRHWSPPKGRVIGKEDELKCAIRETIDITGLSVKDLIVEEDFRAEIKYLAGNSRPKRVVYFLAQVSQHGRIIPPGFTGLHFAWLPLQQAQEKAVFKSMQDVLKQAYQFIEERRVKPTRAAKSQLTESLINRRGPSTAPNSESSSRRVSDERVDSDDSRGWKKAPLKEAVVEKERYAQVDDANEQAQLQQGENGNDNPLYKTRLCERFETEGFCPYGPRCTFAHGNGELRDRPTFGGEVEKKEGPENILYKTRLCERFMKENFCQYGPRCNFAHSMSELRNRPAVTKEKEEEAENFSNDFPEPRRPVPIQQSQNTHTRDKSWSKPSPTGNGIQQLRNENWERKPFVEIKPTKKGENILIQGLQLGKEKSLSRSVSPDKSFDKDKLIEKGKKETSMSLKELMTGKDNKKRFEIIDRPSDDPKVLGKKSTAEKANEIEDTLSRELQKLYINEESTPSVSDQIVQIKRMEVDHELTKQHLLNILVSTFFAEYSTEKLKSHLELFKEIIKTAEDQLTLTRAFEKHLSRHTANTAKTAAMFKDLYDFELVDEDVLLEWYDEVLLKKSEIRRKVKPLVDWLRTAEEEDDE